MTLTEKWIYECAKADKEGKIRFTFLYQNTVYWSKKAFGIWLKPKKV